MDIVKGFKDYTGKDAQKRAVIREVVKQVFEKYNFEPAETPIVEYDSFVRGDNANDDAVSDVYKLTDKGKRKLALRYEFTFQLKRLMKNKKLPYKRFQIGPVFRDEPVQGVRDRQFTTCEADVIGATVKDEAEVLAMITEILNALKIKSVIYVNNRKLLNEIIGDLKISKKVEVIREIDKLDKLPEKVVKENLKKYGAEKLIAVLKNGKFEKYNGYKEIKELKDACKMYGINVKFAPFLARGLSYYNGTVFEIKSNIKESICGGGAYEFNNTQCFGFGVSIERLQAVTKMVVDIEKYLVVSLNQDKKAIAVTKQLRAKGKNASVFYGKPSKALEYANAYGIKKVVFVGEQEVKKKLIKVKDMVTGREGKLVVSKV